MSAKGMRLIDSFYLYNLLNAETTYPCLSDPVYMLLLDAREINDYNESHIVTAKFVQKDDNNDFVLPYDSELECKTHIVVYDSCTDSLEDNKDDSPAISCAQVVWRMGSRHEVEVLKGGYEAFSALFPFLRTHKIMYMPRELDDLQTYPALIIPRRLYLGRMQQGKCAYMQRDLKIKAHVVCSINSEDATFFQEDDEDLFQVLVADADDADLSKVLTQSCEFIEKRVAAGKAVLVYSELAISRSVAVVIAYLMYSEGFTLDTAYKYVRSIRSIACPNQSFLQQLSAWSSQHGAAFPYKSRTTSRLIDSGLKDHKPVPNIFCGRDQETSCLSGYDSLDKSDDEDVRQEAVSQKQLLDVEEEDEAAANYEEEDEAAAAGDHADDIHEDIVMNLKVDVDDEPDILIDEDDHASIVGN